MRVALDAMGGDYAPEATVEGAVAAVKSFEEIEVYLVGPEERLRPLIPADLGEKIKLVSASEVIEMGESPVQAVRRKRASSLVRTVELLKEGQVDAAVSAGNTGALLAAASLYLGRIPGVERPALMAQLPNPRGRTVLLDVGANVDVKPHHLAQFAVMGSIYARDMLGIASPRVGLLSIGEEETKGNELTLATFPLLRKLPLNFIGNVEGRDVFNGRADVVVCDGFVGNVLLKAGEGLVQALEAMLRQELARNLPARILALATFFFLRNFRKRLDYAEYGGAPLLGVNGVVVAAHGCSRGNAIKNALRVAVEAVRCDLVATITKGIALLKREKGVEVS
ncbi:fatty acid/phospholipid synthesis protein PlsX [Ammonifex degensii KC4]|uniref:Phosphate acyltransferase n=1 Tax=Ammonifex degensii (strain DSM 10501 / KC4) TaxID=429009 RepID=C9RCW3_AMMDK|nr:phosphate acyltransferase PlsX [Ammonifex degensii]ACX52090.1 fatty acid/phospholipid synthesis protein PlsX [Ammonifex degensii KC4]